MSPLLAGAMNGSLEVTKWMMSPEATASYVQYIKAIESHPELQKFVTAKEGIETSVSNWLHYRGMFCSSLFGFSLQ
jgi:hypothetical protein